LIADKHILITGANGGIGVYAESIEDLILNGENNFQPLLNAGPNNQGSVISQMFLCENITDAWFTKVMNPSSNKTYFDFCLFNVITLCIDYQLILWQCNKV